MRERAIPPDSRVFDWAIALAALWLGAGIFVDAWYHFHNDVETFFEPAHGLLYAGLLLAYVAAGSFVVRNYRLGYRWPHLVPQGYTTTLVGLVVALVGGFSDMVKHTLWGFEQGFNALLSPTHLLIGAGMFVMIAGLVGNAYARREEQRTLLSQFPLLLAASAMMELLHWGTQVFFQSEAERINAPLPFAHAPHEVLTLLTIAYYKQAIGLFALLAQSLLIAGFALFLKRRFTLAPGALAVLMLLGNLIIAAAQANAWPEFVAVLVASLACGIVGDLFRLDPERGAEWRWYAFAFALPATYWASFLLVIAATTGLWWPPDVIFGSVLFVGFTGALLNAIAPPRLG